MSNIGAIKDEKPSVNATVIVVPQLFYNVQPKNNNHTNYHVWSKKMCAYIESTYNEHGSFIKDNEYYSPPKVVSVMTTRPPNSPVMNPNDDETTVAEKEAILDQIFRIEEMNREIRTRNDFKMKRYDSSMEELPKIRRRMFDSIFNTLSEQSKARLREQDANFLTEVENEKEPLLGQVSRQLMRLSTLVHLHWINCSH